MSRQSLERALHMSVEAFLRLAWPANLPYTHFPAGEARDERTGAKLKAMGLKPGWSDFIFILPAGRVTFLELKAGKGKLSDSQQAFRDRVEAMGYEFIEARSLHEVEDHLSRILLPFGYRLKARAA